jgi:hypothetical protein
MFYVGEATAATTATTATTATRATAGHVQIVKQRSDFFHSNQTLSGLTPLQGPVL